MSGLLLTQDLRYAIRAFRRAPAFTGFVIAILALGMGANLATFSVTDAILFRMLPVKDPGSLFQTVNASGQAYDPGSGSSYPLFLQMRQRTSKFADLMAYGTAALAGPHAILALMLRDSATIVLTGILVGVVVYAPVSHWTKTLLYGLAPNDPATLLASTVLLLAASLLATFIPAYRAAKTNPMIALRHE